MAEAQSSPPMRPVLAEGPSQFVLMERAVEDEYRPRMLQELQQRVEEFAKTTRSQSPACSQCGRVMVCQDVRPVSWLARFGRLRVGVPRYRCPVCKSECRPLLEQMGVEPGRISGSLARDLAVLAAVVPYTLAARLADLLLGVKISSMGIWKVSQRLGQAVANYSEALSRYHVDSRSEGASTDEAPATVLLSVDGCALGMQVRSRRRRRTGTESLPPLHGQLRELGWLGPNTMVVVVGDGAEWIWNRATWFIRRCEILDFWHAMEHAWEFARLRYGEGSQQADQWVRQIGIDLKAGKVEQVIARLKRLRPQSSQLRESLESLIRYYSANAGRMRYDEYLRLGYGIGSGAVESAHKQVVHARLRQAGMRWSEAGARRLLALRLLLLNGDWALLDRFTMVSTA